MAKPTDTPNAEGNFRGQRQSQRDALARGRDTSRARGRDGRVRPRQVAGLQGEASLAISGRLKRFIEAYDDDPEVLPKVAIGQLLADLWDANSLLRPIWVTARRLVTRINNADRKAHGKDAPKNGDSIAEDLKTLEALDGLVPLMDQLGRWHKRTTDVALRLGELSVRLKTATGGKGYLEERYGDDAPGGKEEGEVPPGAEEAEVLDDPPAEPAESPDVATSGEPPPAPDEPLPGPPPEAP